jgi:peroxiredoxin
LPQFEALNAQVVGVSADHAATLKAFTEANGVKHPLLSDFRRQMLPEYGAMVTDEKSRSIGTPSGFFVIDRSGTVRFIKIHDNALDLLKPEDLLKALKESGA